MKNAPVTRWDLTAAALLFPRVIASADDPQHCVEQIAQFLADLQANAAHKAWREGLALGFSASGHGCLEDYVTDNPYPKLDP